MISKQEILCLFIVVASYFDLSNAACSTTTTTTTTTTIPTTTKSITPCDTANGFVQVGSWCVNYVATLKNPVSGKKICENVWYSSLLNTNQWSSVDLVALNNFLNQYGSGQYLEDVSYSYNSKPANTRFTYATTGNSVSCTDASMCNGQCINSSNSPYLFYKNQNGQICLTNKSDANFDRLLCQDTLYNYVNNPNQK